MSQKDQELLQNLIQKYAKLFMKMAYKNGVPYDDVEDVVMDAFWSFYRSKYYESMDEAEIKIMMGRIVKNKCIDYYRKNRKDEEMVADDGDEGLVGIAAHPMTNPERRMIEKEKYRRIRDEIEGLKPIWRDAAKLFLLEERSFSEMSEILGVTEEVCRSRISRLRKHLREVLKDLLE